MLVPIGKHEGESKWKGPFQSVPKNIAEGAAGLVSGRDQEMQCGFHVCESTTYQQCLLPQLRNPSFNFVMVHVQVSLHTETNINLDGSKVTATDFTPDDGNNTIDITNSCPPSIS